MLYDFVFEPSACRKCGVSGADAYAEDEHFIAPEMTDLGRAESR